MALTVLLKDDREAHIIAAIGSNTADHVPLDAAELQQLLRIPAHVAVDEDHLVAITSEEKIDQMISCHMNIAEPIDNANVDFPVDSTEKLHSRQQRLRIVRTGLVVGWRPDVDLAFHSSTHPRWG